jgi:hypothetical protein
MDFTDTIDAEELRFVYKLVLNGRSDSEILDTYAFLRDKGQIDFPLRSETSFVRERRRELEAAAGVLWDNIENMMRPFMSQYTEGHSMQVSEFSASLLDNNLSTVMDRGIKRKPKVYKIMDLNNIPGYITERELLFVFRKNVDAAVKKYGIDFFYKCYVIHLKAEIPEMGREGFWPYAENHTYEVIQKIKEQQGQSQLKGSCPLCNDAKAHLPPLLQRFYASQTSP